LLQQETSFYFVYDRSGVIAYFKLNFNIDPLQQPDLKSMELQRLYVFATRQSVGLGAQIMDFIKALAISLNYRHIWLGVWEHNTKAIQFYKRHGFIKTGEHPFLLGHDLQTDHIYSFIR
jgi:ribosomal protein S18 acetylase RimI-like enzyme